MTEKEQKIILVITCIGTIVAIILGITLAYFRWQSEDNTNVKVTVKGLEITYENGEDISGNLIPVQTKEEGLQKDITIYQDGTTLLNASFYLELTNFPEYLKEESFKWELYRDGTLIDNGNFKENIEGETITLATYQKITTTPSIYTLYLWIDGNMSNPTSMQNQEFTFKLNVDASDNPN